MTVGSIDTAWARGRFGTGRGPGKLLFGRMYEDVSIEVGAFRRGGRVFSILSAGCTAMKLAAEHEVVAVDINPAQVAYARRRLEGAGSTRGAADRFMTIGRSLAPLAGWRASRLDAFLGLEDLEEQLAFWRRHLDTLRFRSAFDLLLCRGVLRRLYAPGFLGFLPPHLGRVVRARMQRCFARHPNRTNPYARALLLGELPGEPAPPESKNMRIFEADAASFLEREPAASFDGFTLSNILDGAGHAYRRRLLSAVKHAASPGAVVVIRSFGEPPTGGSHAEDSAGSEPLGVDPMNRAIEDRAMLWGVVDVRAASAL